MNDWKISDYLPDQQAIYDKFNSAKYWTSTNKAPLIIGGIGVGLLILGFGAAANMTQNFATVNPILNKVFLSVGVTTGVIMTLGAVAICVDRYKKPKIAMENLNFNTLKTLTNRPYFAHRSFTETIGNSPVKPDLIKQRNFKVAYGATLANHEIAINESSKSASSTQKFVITPESNFAVVEEFLLKTKDHEDKAFVCALFDYQNKAFNFDRFKHLLKYHLNIFLVQYSKEFDDADVVCYYALIDTLRELDLEFDFKGSILAGTINFVVGNKVFVADTGIGQARTIYREGRNPFLLSPPHDERNHYKGDFIITRHILKDNGLLLLTPSSMNVSFNYSETCRLLATIVEKDAAAIAQNLNQKFVQNYASQLLPNTLVMVIKKRPVESA